MPLAFASAARMPSAYVLLKPSGTAAASPSGASLAFNSASGGTSGSLRISRAIFPVYSG